MPARVCARTCVSERGGRGQVCDPLSPRRRATEPLEAAYSKGLAYPISTNHR